MKLRNVFFFLLLAGCATKPTQQPVETPKSTTKVVKSVEKSQPAELRDTIVLDHKFFKISYNMKRRLPNFVSYELTAEHLKAKEASREDKFIPDPLLKQKNLPFVVSAEYVKTGYDRGHMAPSADFAWSQEANDLTFVMSNMAPQKPKLNRDAWKRLEEQVRKWACGEEKVTVVTGPVLKERLATLPSGLEIPEAFFKIIIDETPPKKAIAFMYYQEDSGDMLAERMIPLKNIESATGIAFNREFPDLNGKIRIPASTNEWKEADCSK